MLSNLKLLDDATFRSTGTSTLTPTPVETTSGNLDGFSVTINGYQTSDPTTMLFTISGGKSFSSSLQSGGGAIVTRESSTTSNTTLHYSVECGQNLETTAWNFTVNLVDSAGSKIGTFVFAKSKTDEDVLIG